MALPKAHHIETLSEFNSLKFSYDSTNTHYFTGGTDTIVEGTPDILYTDIAYIKPLSAIYTHAKIYPCPILEYDNTPTAGSDNLMTSGNIKTAIDSVTYTAGTGLKLSDNQFSLNVPNVTRSANSLPGQRTARFEEYEMGKNYDLPTTADRYHVITLEGFYTSYATQLALGMTTNAAYYRNYKNGTWGSWIPITNIYTAGSGLKLNSSNEFSLNVPHVTKNANSFPLPAKNTAIIEEYTSMSSGSSNLPTNNVYHILTIVGNYSDVLQATQLALSRDSARDGVYYRRCFNGTWQTWKRLDTPMDSTPTSGHTSSVVSSSGIYTALSSKQDTLTFDDTPTASSNNPVKSGGIDSAIKNNQRVFYAVTETAGATAVKEFTIPDFPTETINGVKTPLKGTIITVTSTNTDARSAQLKFKINDGGEFPIWYNLEEFNSTDTNDKIFGNPIKTYTYTFNGTHWCWTSHGSDNNTIYTAGSGLKLSNNQFSLNVPRVVKSANSLPGRHTATFEEYSQGDVYDLPSNAWYHILTMEGDDIHYATQLALGMTTSAAYYRCYRNSVWESWKRLDNPTMDSTPTAGNTSNVVSSAGIKTYVDTQVATKTNVIFRQWVTQ